MSRTQRYFIKKLDKLLLMPFRRPLPSMKVFLRGDRTL